MKKSLIIGLLIVAVSHLYTQEIVQYKQIDSIQLNLEILKPSHFSKKKPSPAMVFFHGGGWNTGNRQNLKPQAEYFAKRGLVCFLVDYRIMSKHHTTPFESLMDAKSAIRYIRENAVKFNINPNHIIAAGGSAGGQLAAACALTDSIFDKKDNLNISCIPNALVLYNPVVDNSPEGFGYQYLGEVYSKFSPLHNIKKGAPPTLILLGTNDHLVPIETAKEFKSRMEQDGNRCDLLLYEGQKHSFFNASNKEYFHKTLIDVDHFLQSLNLLKKKPRVTLK